MIIVTIITVTTNANDRLAKTLQSYEVLPAGFEVVFVFPADDVETKRQINGWKLEFPKINVQVVNDSKKGIYQAMNEGAEIARGLFLMFLNSGDRILDKKSCQDILNSITKHNPPWAIVGGVSGWNQEFVNNAIQLHSFLNFNPKYLLSHQTVIIKKDIFQAMKGFSSRLKVSADTLQLLTLSRRFAPLYLQKKLVYVEKPNFAALNSRRGRLEMVLVIPFGLRGHQRIRAFVGFLKNEFQALIRKVLKKNIEGDNH